MIYIKETDVTVLFTGRWVFISVFVSSLTNKQFGIRYYLDQTIRSENVIYQSRDANAGYNASGAATVFWGGDNLYNNCNCYLQYVRVYLNWDVDSRDQLINLALMDADGIYLTKFKIFKLLLLLFEKLNSIASILHRIHKQTTIELFLLKH